MVGDGGKNSISHLVHHQDDDANGRDATFHWTHRENDTHNHEQYRCHIVSIASITTTPWGFILFDPRWWTLARQRLIMNGCSCRCVRYHAYLSEDRVMMTYWSCTVLFHVNFSPSLSYSQCSHNNICCIHLLYTLLQAHANENRQQVSARYVQQATISLNVTLVAYIG